MKKNIKIFIIAIIGLLSLIGTIYYSYKVITWYIHINENKKIKKELDEKVKKPTKEKLEYQIDFESLKKINSDTIAYLKVNGTSIDYVVVKGQDNSYYLNHNFEKEWNVNGWVFADYHNTVDEQDKNLIIYAHDTKDGSMFGTLHNILNKEWYDNKDNHIIDLVTEKGTYKYEVFSVYSIEPEDYYINTMFNEGEFNSFVNTLKTRSIYNTNVEVSETDKILTLSSCLYEGKKRVVLHAKLISKI